MSTKTTHVCDKCGKTTNNPIPLNVPVGEHREGGPSYPETVFDYAKYDLCVDCAATLFRIMFAGYRTVDGKWVHHAKTEAPTPACNDAVRVVLGFLALKGGRGQ